MAAQVPYSGVPGVAADVNGSGAQQSGVRVDASETGSLVAGALENTGKVAEQASNQQFDVATQAAQIAGETQVNDMFAKGYAPAVAQLRQNFSQLSDEDKFHGLDKFNSDLAAIGQNANAGLAPYEAKMLSGMIAR